jgi:hypothetical protein
MITMDTEQIAGRLRGLARLLLAATTNPHMAALDVCNQDVTEFVVGTLEGLAGELAPEEAQRPVLELVKD